METAGVMLTEPDNCKKSVQSKVYHHFNEIETHKDYWHEGSPHVVGMSLQVHWVSNVDTVNQTFDAGFYISFEWQPSKLDVDTWKQLKAEDKVKEFMPHFRPQFRFPNVLSLTKEPRRYLDGSIYSLLINGEKDTRGIITRMDYDYMISARYSIRATFGEPFELESFPFDVQDLKIIISSTATTGSQILVPHFRRKDFVKIAVNVSSLPEWDFRAPVAEFKISNPSTSDRGSAYSTCVLNMKVARRFQSYVVRIMSLMGLITLATFTVFSLEPVDDMADRLANSFTLVLTGLVFMFVVDSRLPTVPYLTLLDAYTYVQFILMLLIALESAVIPHVPDAHDIDRYILYGLAGGWVLYQIYYFFTCYFARKAEMRKLKMNSTAVEKDIKQLEVEHVKIHSHGTHEPIKDYWSDFDPATYALNRQESNIEEHGSEDSEL